MSSSEEEQRLVQAGGTINLFVWLVASVVMVFSAFAGAELLAHHDVPWGLGLAGGLAVDAALVVALIGDRQLHRYGQRAPWGTALRWATAGMSLVLNCGQSAERGDWVAAGLHAIFPVLLIVLTEASQGYQIAFSRAVLKAQHEREGQAESVPGTEHRRVPASGTRPTQVTGTRSVPTQVRSRRSSTGPSSRRSATKPARANTTAVTGRWTAEQWTRAVELVASYQRDHGRDPKLGEFHSGLRMSRNAASPLRNAVLEAVAKHGPDSAKALLAGSSTEPESTPGTGTEASVVELPTSGTSNADTGESVHAN